MLPSAVRPTLRPLANLATGRSRVAGLRNQATYYADLLQKLPADLEARAAVQTRLDEIVTELVTTERDATKVFLHRLGWWSPYLLLVASTIGAVWSFHAGGKWRILGWTCVVVAVPLAVFTAFMIVLVVFVSASMLRWWARVLRRQEAERAEREAAGGEG